MTRRRKYKFRDLKLVAERVKQSVNIMEVMENAGIRLVNKSTRGAKAACFNHGETDPSLVVSSDKQLFNCFGAGCSVGGDVIAFVMQHDRCDFLLAVSMLVEQYGIDVSDLLEPESDDDRKRERYVKIYEHVAHELHRRFIASKGARQWLARKGITDAKVLSEFQIGYAQSPSIVKSVASGYGATDQEMKLLQLDSLGLFTHRIIYPLKSCEGDVLSFYGRTLSSDSQMKYLGMHTEHKELKLSHPLLRKESLFGLEIARSYAKGQHGQVIVVEGFNDVLGLHCHGIRNSIAMRGSAPTKEQYDLLKSIHISDIVVCPDPDSAGARTIEQISKNRDKHQSVKIMTLPTGLDPDEFVYKHGAEAFRSRVAEAVYPVEIVIRNLAPKLDGSMTSKIDVTREMVNYINLLSGYEREFAITELCSMTELDKDVVDQALADEDTAELHNADLEAQAVYDMMTDQVKAVTALSYVTEHDFSVQRNAKFFRCVESMLANDIKPFTREMFIAYGIDKELLMDVDTAYVPTRGVPQGTDFEYALKKLKMLALRRRLVKAGTRFIGNVKQGKADTDDVVDQHLKEISLCSATDAQSTSASDHVIQAMEVIHERMANPGIPGVNIGANWKKLMNQILGFQPGHMISVAAISKAGKTAIAQNWCLQQLMNVGEPTLWINLEMSEVDLTMRNLSIMTEIDLHRLKVGNISRDEKALLDEQAAIYHNFNLYVSSMAGATASEVVNAIRRHHYTNGVRIVFIDYVQLIAGNSRSSKDSLWEVQNEIVGQIRKCISSLPITGIVISQLNRGAMADKAASGQYVSGTIKLIQDSDVFMGLRPKDEDEIKLTPHSNSSLLIEFNRHGPQGTEIDLDFKRSCMRITEA